MMVKNGQHHIQSVKYAPPTAEAAGVEVMSITELHRRRQHEPAAHRAQRLDFHLLLNVTRGHEWHMVDFHSYGLVPDTWLWVRPGQVQRYGDLTGVSGHVVMFPRETPDPDTAQRTALDEPSGAALWRPGDSERRALTVALDHLRREYDDTSLDPALRSTLLRHLLSVILLRLSAASGRVASRAGESPEVSETFARFRAAVERDFAVHRDLAHYATSLGYAPRTLTRATQVAVGEGAKSFIDGRVVLEAQRLLAHVDDPVASIASALGFTDASNFVKFFHLRTGQTPAAFRASFRSRR